MRSCPGVVKAALGLHTPSGSFSYRKRDEGRIKHRSIRCRGTMVWQVSKPARPPSPVTVGARSLKPKVVGSFPTLGAMNTIIEVRAGDGGDDAAAFARELAQAIAVYVSGTITSKTEVSTKESL